MNVAIFDELLVSSYNKHALLLVVVSFIPSVGPSVSQKICSFLPKRIIKDKLSLGKNILCMWQLLTSGLLRYSVNMKGDLTQISPT